MARPILCAILVVTLVSAALSAGAQRAAATGPVILRGIVVDAETGIGVPRMRLDVLLGGKRTAGVLTRDDGTFSVEITAQDRLSIAPFASLTVRTFKAGYATMTVSFAPDQVRAPDGVRLTAARAGVITGRVVTGPDVVQPLPMVFARRDGDGRASGQDVLPTSSVVPVIPDEDGAFRIGALPAGRYRLDSPLIVTDTSGTVRTISSGGGMRLVSATVDVKAGEEVTGVHLVMESGLDITSPSRALTEPAGSLIRGRVITTDGLPVSNATVTARLGTSRSLTVSDASGQFTLGNVSPGSVGLSAEKPGYLRAEYGQRGATLPGLPVVVEKGRNVEDVTITLSRGGLVSGIVVDEHNEPLPDVAIQLSRVRQSSAGLVIVEPSAAGRSTDDRGVFRIPDIRPGDYLLRASLPSELTTELSIGTSGPRTAYVPAFYPDTHDAAGAWPLRVAPGDVVAGVVLTIRRVPVVRLTGVVQNSEGAPLVGTLRLTSRHLGSALPARVAQPDADGAFAFAELPPGEYVLRASTASGPNGPEVAQRPVTVIDTDPEPVAMRTFPSSVVSGHLVLDAPPGEPLWGYSIRTMQAEATGSGGGMTNLGSPTSNGHPFTISSLSGPTRIVASTDDANWYLRAITIDGIDATDVPFNFGFDGRRYTGAELVFSRFAAIVSGRAIDDRAMPQHDYAVHVFPTDRDKWFPGSRWLKLVRSGSDGTFRVPALPPGEYWLAAVDRVETLADSAEWVDSDLLDALSAGATRATFGEGQAPPLTLRVTRR